MVGLKIKRKLSYKGEQEGKFFCIYLRFAAASKNTSPYISKYGIVIICRIELHEKSS